MSAHTPSPDSPVSGDAVVHEDSRPAGDKVSASAGGSHRKEQASGSTWKTVAEYAFTIAIALLVAVLIKTFLVQPFYIPSASMHPTLMEQDKILVSKVHPGIFDIERGDVIVFQDPGNWVDVDHSAPLSGGQQLSKVLSYVGLAPDPTETHLVKRLIAVGGDRVVCESVGGPMSVNGVELEEPYIVQGPGACHNRFDVVVPHGKLWVMGDNRFNSADSSEHYARGEEGFVDESLVTGKAVLLFMPFDHWSTLGDAEGTFAELNAR